MKIFIPIKEISQRVPKKNFREFKNIPLYQYVISKYTKVRNFEIHINTDSKEIYEWCKNNGVITHMRKSSLIGHKVSVTDLILDFIESNDINDIICQLHVTSPLLNPKTIIEASSYIEEGYDSVVGCDVIYNRFWEKKRGKMKPINHNPNNLIQTQDLEPLYLENSSFYMFNSQTFMKTKNRIGDNPYFYEVKYPQNLDIDTEDDWNLIKKFD
jgi:CMP-N-acetylneuraminic acid synthetase